MVFTFIGYDNSGKKIFGAKKAKSKESIVNFISEQDINYYEIFQSKTKLHTIFKIPIPLEQQTIFFQKLFILTSSGSSLTEALWTVRSSIRNKQLKIVAHEIFMHMENGLTFSNAFSMYSHIFDDYIVSMIGINNSNSELTYTFDEISKYLEIKSNLNKKIKSDIIYPIFLITLISLSSLIFSIKILPNLKYIFYSFIQKETKYFDFLFRFITFFSFCLSIIFIILTLFIFFLFIFSKTNKGSFLVDKLKIINPITKTIYLNFNTLTLIKTFSIFSNRDLELKEALEYTIIIIENKFCLELIKENLGNLNYISNKDLIEKSSVFSPSLNKILFSNNTNLPIKTSINKASIYFENELYASINFLSNIFSNILLFLLLFIIIIILIIILVPSILIIKTI